jgi:hypothetical protein
MGDSIARRLSSRQNRDRHLKQLRKLLSLADKPSALEAFWIIDGARNAHHFVKPSSSTFPDEFLFAKFGEPGAIYPWELEALVIELLAVERTQEARRELNLQSWGAISKLVNHVRAIENAESGMREPGIIMRELTRILNRQLPWQMHNWNAADSVRWWSIFQSSVLQEIFVTNVGVRLKTFIQLGMAWSLDLDTSPFVKHPGAAPELGITKTDASNLVRAISLPAQTATAKVKAAVRDGQELAYRHSFLRERPVIALARNGKPVFIRPLHQLLVWRLTAASILM